jgi:hypothetical protein
MTYDLVGIPAEEFKDSERTTEQIFGEATRRCSWGNGIDKTNSDVHTSRYSMNRFWIPMGTLILGLYVERDGENWLSAPARVS